MFGKTKLNPDHKFLIDALAKETGQSKEEVLYYVLETGFTKLRLGTEQTEIAKLLRNWIK